MFEFVKSKAEANKHEFYEVTPTLVFTKEQLDSPKVYSFTAKQLFDMLNTQAYKSEPVQASEGSILGRHQH